MVHLLGMLSASGLEASWSGRLIALTGTKDGLGLRLATAVPPMKSRAAFIQLVPDAPSLPPNRIAARGSFYSYKPQRVTRLRSGHRKSGFILAPSTSASTDTITRTAKTAARARPSSAKRLKAYGVKHRSTPPPGTAPRALPCPTIGWSSKAFVVAAGLNWL